MMRNPQDIRFLKGATWPGQYPSINLPEVAFVGRSNVGKSSLINALVGRKGLARASKTPGKTQVIQFYLVNNHLVLVDLPGYGYARVKEETRRNWKPMVERYVTSRETLCSVVLLIDFRRTPSEQDLQMKAWLDHHAMPYVAVLTKADKISRGRRLQQMRRISRAFDMPLDDLILFSAMTGEGRRKLWRFVLRAVREANRKSS